MPILKCEFMCCYFRLLRSHSEAGYNTSHCVKTWMGFTEKSVTVAIIWSIQSSWFTVVSKAISRFYPDPSRPSHIITDGVSVQISRLQLWWSLSCYRGDPGIITMLFAIFSQAKQPQEMQITCPWGEQWRAANTTFGDLSPSIIFSLAVYEWSSRSCSQQAPDAVCDSEVNQSFLSVLLCRDLLAPCTQEEIRSELRKEESKNVRIHFLPHQ